MKMKYGIMRGTSGEAPLFSLPIAAKLARISAELIEQCIAEGLVEPRTMLGGGVGLTAGEVRRLARIRSLHEDLELDIYAIQVVLRMRRQVVQLLDRVEEIEQRSARREQLLLGEIRTLHRRLAEEPDWR
jgi:hypothetical protein